MQYKKVSIQLTPYNETVAALLTAQMGEIGFDSFEDTNDGIVGYAMESNYDEAQLKTLSPMIEGISIQYSIETIPDEDWNKEWEQTQFKPIVIANQCRIRSPYHEPDTSIAYEIVIDPQMSFGTGYHETTTMMIEYLIEKQITNAVVLDMGCGTGILGIMASKRGAKSVECIDIDEWCYKNTQTNAALNKISNISIRQGDARLLTTANKYDIVMANINRNILVADMKHYANALKKGGAMMLSGFYTADANIVEAEAKRFGLQLVETKVLNDWNALYFSKK